MNTASKDASGHVARWSLKPGIWSEPGYLTRQPLPMNHLLDISAWCDGILKVGTGPAWTSLMFKGQLSRSANPVSSSLQYKLSWDQESSTSQISRDTSPLRDHFFGMGMTSKRSSFPSEFHISCYFCPFPMLAFPPPPGQHLTSFETPLHRAQAELWTEPFAYTLVKAKLANVWKSDFL